MDEIPAIYAIENIEQLRAISDRLRLRIFETLGRQAMTVAQLSAQLGLAHSKVHYHVRELEQVGLVKLVETREKGGILEKYYRAIAHDLRVPNTLFRSVPLDESAAIIGEYLRWIASGFQRAFAQGVREKEQGRSEAITAALDSGSLFVTRAEATDLAQRIRDLMLPYTAPRGVPGEREHAFAQLLFTELPELEEHEEEQAIKPAIGAPAPASGLPGGGQSEPRTRPSDETKVRRVMVAGALAYSRADLEQAVDRGERLDIFAVGLCSFADDIPVELADRAIARFRYRGALNASPEVRAVLERKQKEAKPFGRSAAAPQT